MTPERPAGGGGPSPSVIAVVTCPGCESETKERMPEDACVVVWDCPACGVEVRPRADDCCVFCSYGSVPCPPQQGDAGS